MIKVKLKKRKPQLIAIIEFTGEYSKIPWGEYLEKISAWAKRSGAKAAFSPPFGIYYDNPEFTEPDQCKSAVGMVIKKAMEPQEGIIVKELPETDMAVTRFKGPAEELTKAYSGIGHWVEDNGYEGIEPPRELYMGMPKEKNGKVILSSEIQIAVKKKGA